MAKTPKKTDRTKTRKVEGIADKRKQRRDAVTAANKVTVILDTDLRKHLAASARAAGMDLSPYLLKAIETHVIETTPSDDPLNRRLLARRDVLDRAVALARKLDGEGRFDEHFVLTVMREAARDPDFARSYEAAAGADPDKPRRAARARVPLNQQLGRLIKRAAGAKSKRNPAGKIQRAQVQGEVIAAYTLLVRDAKAAA